MGETRDKLLGLGLGATEYLTKPINPLELGTRIRHLLGRSPREQARAMRTKFHGEGYSFDAVTPQLSAETVTHFLAQAEARLLHSLLDSEGEVLTRDQLSQFVCGRDWVPGDRTVDVLMNRLRGHLTPTPIKIVTVHRTGYLATVETQPEALKGAA